MRKRGRNGTNGGLKSWQEGQKNNSINAVKTAIETRLELGYQDITIKMLMKDTGLSRPVFSKDHIKDVLVQYGIGKYKVNLKLPPEHQEKIEYLKDELFKAKTLINKLEEELNKKEIQNSKLIEQRDKLIKEQEYLNYDIYELKRKLVIYSGKK